MTLAGSQQNMPQLRLPNQVTNDQKVVQDYYSKRWILHFLNQAAPIPLSRKLRDVAFAFCQPLRVATNSKFSSARDAGES